MPDRLTRTFLDSGVLIAAYNARRELKAPALAVLKDPDRVFLSSPFVRHEVCPKALFNKRHQEYRFYREYFRRAVMFNDVRLVLERASRESAKSGVNAMDSIHLAAAHLLRSDEFITTETPRKSIYRSSLVKIVYLFG
ncbi:MAG: type II toxin-antitoxin system VapC family toxin [Acidobacteria bacterium]|nr:type II toxin-antitoxin system VapC family toxin [Acidobacteriota bacterium]MBI3473032.1 type II toxin-antitoxin system VapC family toxin [Candidatus Solibacter usitatus]